MGFNLKNIEEKLNSFNDKINEIGNQVSDALNKGASSLDGALNSCVNSIDNKVDEYVQKKEQEKNENKGIELTKEEPITLVKEEPVAEELEGFGVQNEVSAPSVIKPAIPVVDLEKSDSDNVDSVINLSSLDKGVNLEKN